MVVIKLFHHEKELPFFMLNPTVKNDKETQNNSHHFYGCMCKLCFGWYKKKLRRYSYIY